MKELQKTVEDGKKFNKCDFHKEYHHFNTSFGLIMEDKYCSCGKMQQIYDKTTDFKYTLNDKNFREREKSANRIFEIDKKTLYLTKRSLMFNQFLEQKDSNNNNSSINPKNNNVNRFNNTKVENSTSLLKDRNSSMLDLQMRKNASTIQLSSPVFSDKRLVSIFRSVALYCFFCMNTDLSKNDVCKKKYLNTINISCEYNPELTFDTNILEFKILPNILENYDIASDVWCIITDRYYRCGNDRHHNNYSLLSYSECSRNRVFNVILKNLFVEFIKNFRIWITQVNKRQVSLKIYNVKTEQARNKTYVLLDIGFKNYEITPKTLEQNKWFDKIILQIGNIEFKSFCLKSNSEHQTLANNFRAILQQNKIFASVTDKDFFDENIIKSSEENSDETEQYFEPKIEDKSELSASLNSEEYYFLPEGIFNADETEYPVYNLWRSPLTLNEIIPFKFSENKSPEKKNEYFYSDIKSTSTYKQYHLWESPFVAEEDFISNFDLEEDFSMYSVPHPDQKNHDKAQISTYNLWDSLNIIDFLPGKVGSRPFIDDICFSSSDSSEDVCSQTPCEIINAYQKENHVAQNSYCNLSPVINKLVSFTDDGAFKYYKNPKEITESSMLDFEFKVTVNDQKEISEEDETDEEIQEICSPDLEALIADINTSYYFKPIDPVLKVKIDPPPSYERSESGTYYLSNRRLFPYKHEINSDNAKEEEEAFQPKYLVSSNDKACQTDNFFQYSPTYVTSSYDTIPLNSSGCNEQNISNQSQNSHIACNLTDYLNFRENHSSSDDSDIFVCDDSH